MSWLYMAVHLAVGGGLIACGYWIGAHRAVAMREMALPTADLSHYRYLIDLNDFILLTSGSPMFKGGLGAGLPDTEWLPTVWMSLAPELATNPALMLAVVRRRVVDGAQR